MADGTGTQGRTTAAHPADGGPEPAAPERVAGPGTPGAPAQVTSVVPAPAPGTHPAPPVARTAGPERRRTTERNRQVEGPHTGPVTASRMLSRLARFGQHRQSSVSPVLEPLLRTVRTTHPKADLSVVERAFERAEHAHDGQRRKSGDPYITHPVAVATILAELGMTPSTLAAALLHDTVEDTDYSLTDLRREFGDEIAQLVDGVTKLDKVTYGEAAQSETVRKMIVAMAKDIRVLVIKLADRLHNARTWRYVPAASAEKKARETLEIYAPLAHRLGMNTIKWELEDLAFATVYPKRFDEIVRLVADRAPAREEYLAGVRGQIEEDLKSARVRATVTGRPKHYYSIYQKMIVRGRDFAEIYDLVGVRVLVDSVRDCYAVLGALHARWNPVPGRFKDYIAMPKFNMYQSLHTTVIGPEGKPVEIQIRTFTMHRRAEYGVAAHWKYKDDPNATGGARGDNEMDWLKSVLEWQRESPSSEFLDDLRFEINAGQVFVFTPKGDVRELPAGSTPVDFAYAVHTEVGHRTMGARVNGRLVPLDSTLDNGDLVEVFTSKADGAGPSRDWLQFVKSPRARNKIKQFFSKERREEAIDLGKDEIARAMRKQHLPLQRLMSHESLLAVARELNLADVSALYAAVGEKHVSAQHVVEKIVVAVGGEAAAEEDLAEATTPGAPGSSRAGADAGIVVNGNDDVWVKLAKCCTPVPTDAIVGFVTRGQGVSVHRQDCENVTRLRREPERIVDVEWGSSSSPSGGSRLFLVQIQVEALDRARLLSDVTRVLSDNHVNILSATVSTSRDRVAVSKFSFEMAEPNHLGHVLAAVRRVDGVFDAYRV
ncbi:RelA/SpoT family protein [Kineococcus gypseus]|uniref:RelA/SpoT family protein n=1 Tax=Kineococcus gypseus TaxID=1637102 RepID=UPI003D7C36E5